MEKYFPPAHNSDAFTCPHCEVYSHQTNGTLHLHLNGVWQSIGHGSTQCARCGQFALWAKGNLVYPNIVTAPQPNDDMPEGIKADFEEARQIANRSPRGAAALLRLCLQKLMVHFGEPGENINADIKSLVAKGLPESIQKAADALRIIGNNAIHPGELDLKDTPELAMSLFGLVNIIVDNRISEPKRIAEIYSVLPPTTVAAIQQRDAPKP